MKRTIIATALLAAAGVANAGLSFSVLSTETRSEAFGKPGNAIDTAFSAADVAARGSGSLVSTGALMADSAMELRFTYLGSEAAYDNVLKSLYVGGTTLYDDSDNPSRVPTGYVPSVLGVTSINLQMTSAGAVDFMFEGDSTYGVNRAYNDRVLHAAWSPTGVAGWSDTTSIGLIGTNMVVAGKTYAYVLGYNDSAGQATLGDWDDFVIGVNAVPEPETYAMLLAGLGLMGFVARRRKQSATA